MLARFIVLISLCALSAAACAQEPANRQPLTDAWWTGPMLAASASSLPRGHFLIEPYLFDIHTRGFYDEHGTRTHARRTNTIGSLTYILYGLTNRFTVGAIPTFGYDMGGSGPSSSGPQLGDISLHAQYRFTQFREERRIPTTSLIVQQTLPTGHYDRLGTRSSNGFGSGAYATKLALYSQTYFWLPNGRILRVRVDVSGTVSKSVPVRDASVYGTEDGFRGEAKPGASFFVDTSFEYSLKRHLVLALDVTYGHDRNTSVAGRDMSLPDTPVVRLNSGSRDSFGLAPAIEYSLNQNVGLLFGARVIPAGRNTAYTLTPAVAINIVH